MSQVNLNGIPSACVIGVGGAGGSLLNHLHLQPPARLPLVVTNTDARALESSLVLEKLLLGQATTRGWSTGGEAALGRQVAQEERASLRRLVQNRDLVFICAGLGGGCGSGVAPVLAEEALGVGALVIACVTQPLSLEGSQRLNHAERALKELRQHCHAILALPNDLLLQQLPDNASALEAFALADEWLTRAIRSVWAMLTEKGILDFDFAALRRVFAQTGGKTLYGFGEGEGDDPLGAALESLDACPLLHLPQHRYGRKADALLVHLAGGTDLTLRQVHRAMDALRERFEASRELLLGATVDGSQRGKLRLTALGVASLERSQSAPAPGASRGTEREYAANGKKGRRKASDQEEFTFGNEEESRRGLFDGTDANLHEGEDLDVPTFLRRGIKIDVKA